MTNVYTVTVKYNKHSYTYVSYRCPDNAIEVIINTNQEILEELTLPNTVEVLTISNTFTIHIKNIKLPSNLKKLSIIDNHYLQCVSDIKLPDGCEFHIHSQKLHTLQNIQFAQNGTAWILNCPELSCLDNVIFPDTLTEVVIGYTAIKYIPRAFSPNTRLSTNMAEWFYSPPEQELDATYITEHALATQELEDHGLCLLPEFIAVWYYEKQEGYDGTTICYYSVREIAILEMKN